MDHTAMHAALLLPICMTACHMPLHNVICHLPFWTTILKSTVLCYYSITHFAARSSQSSHKFLAHERFPELQLQIWLAGVE